MRRYLVICAVMLVFAVSSHGHGLLIPTEKEVPPLAMLNHQVNIAIEDQAATTSIEQTFRNHTDRDLEATYMFPVPKGASVRNFTMWVDGKEVKGELLEADKARPSYEEIVRRTQNPGLLEYMGNNLLRLRVFPVKAKADQKVALKFTSIAQRDRDLVEYIYPLKTDGKATRTLEKFSLQATIKSQHSVQNIYSPTHAISINRPNDREAVVRFEREQALLDKDFQVFYSVGDKDVGMTVLTQRPVSTESGYALLLLSPRVETSKNQIIPRDVVLVLDTSGSMRGVKMDQARRALKYCLSNLASHDRFAVLGFATTVNKYRDQLTEASKEQLDDARKWAEKLEATGGTAINDALKAALQMRSKDTSRTFMVVFFTDGMPTVGETAPAKIVQNVTSQNSANTRIFTFGVGDDVNATMLDQLAEQTRALSTYVRPAEDIEEKVSSLYSKISNPVLADVKLTAGPSVTLQEMYPPQLPDLFVGGQVVVLARYTGQGSAALKLTGTVGTEMREFVFEATFPDKTSADREFVEHLWARRKVGYLLDQIRVNGEKKELVDETVALAKKYGIATPYTSYLIVPDGPVPVAGQPANGRPDVRLHLGGAAGTPVGLAPADGAGNPLPVRAFAKEVQGAGDELAKNRGKLEDRKLARVPTGSVANEPALQALVEAKGKKEAYEQARDRTRAGRLLETQTGKLGVDLSVQNCALRCQERVTMTALRNVGGRSCLDVGGVWIDEGYNAKMPTLSVKALSPAYFKLLQKHPKLKEVFQLGNHLVWVAPSGTALILDMADGKEDLTDAEIDQFLKSS
jgi:Ca-activated chloride channel family protein